MNILFFIRNDKYVHRYKILLLEEDLEGKQYLKLVEKISPKVELKKTLPFSFLIGGFIVYLVKLFGFFYI